MVSREELVNRVTQFGFYREYDFNEIDSELRHNIGLHCEEFFSEKDISTVLRNLAKNPHDSDVNFKVLIINANEVLENPTQVKQGTYALYLPITRGMTMEEIKKYKSFDKIGSQTSSKCTTQSQHKGFVTLEDVRDVD